jgi:superfamily II DNA or RNA helicase
LKSWNRYDRLLGVAAVGAGKTLIATAVIRARLPKGRLLAHRDELLDQAIDKLKRAAGIVAAREQAGSHADLSDAVVVGSIQTLHVARLERWPAAHFKTVIIDEATAQRPRPIEEILEQFTRAKVLGITATPDRSDQRWLGGFEEIAFAIGLPELIEQGISPLSGLKGFP